MAKTMSSNFFPIYLQVSTLTTLDSTSTNRKTQKLTGPGRRSDLQRWTIQDQLKAQCLTEMESITAENAKSYFVKI